jgi:hypothetical protein
VPVDGRGGVTVEGNDTVEDVQGMTTGDLGLCVYVLFRIVESVLATSTVEETTTEEMTTTTRTTTCKKHAFNNQV